MMSAPRLLTFLVVASLALSMNTSIASTRVKLSSDPDLPMRLTLDKWAASGWVVQQYQSHIEIKFSDSDWKIVPAVDLLDRMEGYLSEVSSEFRDDATFLRFTLSCECIPAVSGDGQVTTTIDIIEKPDVRQAAHSNVRHGSVALAPTFAPNPQKKPDSSTNLSTTDGIDLDEARDRLIAQLRRAADAGIVEMKPTFLDSKDESALDENLQTVPPSQSPTEEEIMERVTAAATDGADIIEYIYKKHQDKEQNKTGPEVRSFTDETLSSAGGGDSLPPRTPDYTKAIPEPTQDQNSHSEESHESAPEEVVSARQADPVCYANDVFDFSNFSNDENLADKISEKRRFLIGEFDRASAEQAIDLAKLYIFAGLTIEAREILRSFAPEHDMHTILHELSLLRDEEEIPADATIMKSDCTGDQSLWRAYAWALSGDGNRAIQAELAAGRALERLPVGLRERVAGWIGDAAAKQGKWDSARRMQTIVDRASTGVDDMSGRSHLLFSKLAFWNGDVDSGVAHLQRAAASDRRTAAEALFELGERALNQPAHKMSETENLRADLGSLARFLDDQDQANRAFELEVKLANRTYTHDEAMDLLNHGMATGAVAEDRHNTLLTEVMLDPIAGETSDPLAVTYLENPNKFNELLEQTAFRKEIARSMIDLNIPRLATDFLRPEDFDDTQFVLDLSRALISSGDSREAVDVVNSLPDGSVKSKLLAETLLLNGAPEQAISHLDSALLHATDMAERSEILLNKAQAARSSGNEAVELEALEGLFSLDPTIERAHDIAMLALNQARSTIPTAVREFLIERSPEILSNIEPLFENGGIQKNLETPDAIDTYLKQIDTEEMAIQELLSNG